MVGSPPSEYPPAPVGCMAAPRRTRARVWLCCADVAQYRPKTERLARRLPGRLRQPHFREEPCSARLSSPTTPRLGQSGPPILGRFLAGGRRFTGCRARPRGGRCAPNPVERSRVRDGEQQQAGVPACQRADRTSPTPAAIAMEVDSLLYGLRRGH